MHVYDWISGTNCPISLKLKSNVSQNVSGACQLVARQRASVLTESSILDLHPTTSTSQTSLVHPRSFQLSPHLKIRHQNTINRRRTNTNSHFDSICLPPSSPIRMSTPRVQVPMLRSQRVRQMLRAWSIIVRSCNQSLTRESELFTSTLQWGAIG